MLFTPSLYATEYQSFTNVSYSNQNNDSNFESYSINSQYFFDEKSSLGPLDQFKYINTTSYLNAGFSQLKSTAWNTDSSYIGGMYFMDKWSIGGGYNKLSSNTLLSNSHSNNLSLGYLINDNFSIRYSKSTFSNHDNSSSLSMQYNHQINDKDYLGFSLDDDKNASVTYFSHLGEERYLKIGLNYFDDSFGSKWSTNVKYYFNNRTSIFANYHDDKVRSIGAKYFLNQNFALSASYSPENSDIKDDAYNLTLTAQF